MTYGVSSALFIALRTILQHMENEKDSYPLPAQMLLSDIYVDDIVTVTSSFLKL